MATAKPVTDGQECVSLWQAGLLVFWPEFDATYTTLPDYNSACIKYGYTADEWAKQFADVTNPPLRTRYYVLVEDDNEE